MNVAVSIPFHEFTDLCLPSPVSVFVTFVVFADFASEETADEEADYVGMLMEKHNIRPVLAEVASEPSTRTLFFAVDRSADILQLLNPFPSSQSPLSY